MWYDRDRSVDLERDRLARVDAHLGREALNARVAVALGLPVALGIAREAVLTRDLIGAGRARRERVGCARR